MSHHFAKYSGHNSCDSSDRAVNIFLLTFQDHLIKGSGDFMEESSSLYIPILPTFVATNIVLIDI